MSDIINLTLEDCEKITKTYLNSEKVKIVDISVVHLGNETYSIKIKTNRKNQEKHVRLLADSPISETTEILQELTKHNSFTPKLLQLKPNLQVFEDLYWQGFQKYNLENLDINHIKIVLKSLAKLHASSLTYEEFKSKHTKSVYRLNEHYKLNCSNLDLPKAEALIRSIADDKSEEYLSEVIKNLERVQSGDRYRRILCHANLILDNFLFKYQDNTPSECRLINFKSKLYAPPAYDVLQMIFFNADEDLRQHQFHNFLNFYYQNLQRELKLYSLKVENFVSLEDWQLQTHEFLPIIKLEGCLRKKRRFQKEVKEDLNCPILLREDCYQIVKNNLKTSFYKFIFYQVSPMGSVSGFLGAYHKLKIKVLHENEEKMLYGFIKSAPKVKASRNVVNDSNGFVKEAFIYEIIVPKFRKLGIDIIAECLPEFWYKRAQELIILQDLAMENYQTVSTRNSYDFETLELAVKKLAKFHASAFIFEEKMSIQLGRKYRLNEEFNDFFREAIIIDDGHHSGARFIGTGVKALYHAINLFPELKTEENLRNFESKWNNLKKIFYSTLKASEKFRNVLSHGDLWSSNILIKFQNGKPVDCRFVDYQLIRYCPPAHDFLSLIYLTTTKKTQLKYEDNLKGIYHNELKKVLEDFGFDIEEILPYDDFCRGIDLMRPEMIMQAAIYGMFSMCTSQEITSFLYDEDASFKIFFEDRFDLVKTMCETSPIYKARLKERIVDILEYCNSLE